MTECHVLNLGAGVQSTCLYLMAAAKEIRIDAAIFADTQSEPTAVYDHLKWLQSLDGPKIMIRTRGSLADNIRNGVNGVGGRFISIPAFTVDLKGKVGITRRQCTKEYKIEVIEKCIRREILGLKPRQWIPRDTTVYQYFGISTDEAPRAVRSKANFQGRRGMVPMFPLIDRNLSRKDCIAYNADRVPHVVPKSACTFCPYRTNQSWKQLKAEDPNGWNRAVDIDHALRDKDSICGRGFRQEMYLHRSCVPLDLIDFDTLAPSTLDPMQGECQGMCGL